MVDRLAAESSKRLRSSWDQRSVVGRLVVPSLGELNQCCCQFRRITQSLKKLLPKESEHEFQNIIASRTAFIHRPTMAVWIWRIKRRTWRKHCTWPGVLLGERTVPSPFGRSPSRLIQAFSFNFMCFPECCLDIFDQIHMIQNRGSPDAVPRHRPKAKSGLSALALELDLRERGGLIDRRVTAKPRWVRCLSRRSCESKGPNERDICVQLRA